MHVFAEEREVLASISTYAYNSDQMCEIEMSSVLDETIRPYENDKCDGRTKSSESHNFYFDLSLPLELKGKGFSYLIGF